MKLAPVLLDADPRDDWLAGVRIAENDAKLARRFAELHAIEAQRLTLARLEIHSRQRRGALVVLGVEQPAAIRADAGPIFVGLARGELPRAFQRIPEPDLMVEREMPEIVVGHAAVRHGERATP